MLVLYFDGKGGIFGSLQRWPVLVLAELSASNFRTSLSGSSRNIFQSIFQGVKFFFFFGPFPLPMCSIETYLSLLSFIKLLQVPLL